MSKPKRPTAAGFHAAGKTRGTVFVQFFSSYFLLFIIPVAIVSLITYHYLLQMIGKEVESSNLLIMTHFSSTMDSYLRELQEDSILLLNSPSVLGLIRMNREGDFHDNPDRVSVIKDLALQLDKMFDSRPFIDSAYLYLPKSEGVVDSGGYYTADYYFSYNYRFADAGSEQKTELAELFEGRKMTAFTNVRKISKVDSLLGVTTASGNFLSAITSFPFHSNVPEAYLVVNIHEDKFKDMIRIDDGIVMGTLILDGDGRVLSQAGPSLVNAGLFSEVIGNGTKGSALATFDGTPVQIHYARSEFNQWKYISVIDLYELRKPVRFIERLFILLLLLFLVAGVAIAYSIGRKMYRPIREIKLDLERVKGLNSPSREPLHNEYDLIKQWSGALIKERKTMNQQLDGMKPIIHEHFLSKVLLGELKDELSIRMYGEEIGIAFPMKGTKTVWLLDIHFPGTTSGIRTETDKRFRLIELKNVISREWESRVWLCQMDARRLSVITESCSAESLKSLLQRRFPDLFCTIAVGQEVDSVALLHESYWDAERLLKWKRFDRQNEIIDAAKRNGDDTENQNEHYLSQAEINIVSGLVRSGDPAACRTYVEKLLDELLKDDRTAQQMMAWSVDMLNALIRVAASGQNRDFSMERYFAWYDQLQQCYDSGELKRFFAHVVEEATYSREKQRDVFDDVLAYIQKHYKEDLTLEMFAARYNMSLGYFSRTFKEVVGEKYIEYLTRHRLNVAKRLLMETDKKIEDISEEVGYLGRNSFINIFKKYEGVTPGKYRLMHRRN
ncbi:helix-turn-helix domain-containing protein [Paenibacillus tarimensis]